MFVDPGLLSQIRVDQDARFVPHSPNNSIVCGKPCNDSFFLSRSDFGKNPEIVNYAGNMVTLRRADGALVVAKYDPLGVLRCL